jgi:flotillin
MNPQGPFIIIATIVIALVVFVQMIIVLSRYRKVGPNEALIVSGRKIRLPDGRVLGYRIVKGGGTFVFPIIERADTLSLEVVGVEMPRMRVQAAGGRGVEADCAGQVKIKSDDTSIVAAAEHFLKKNPDEIKNIVRPLLEQHLNRVIEASSVEEIVQNPSACAAKVQAAAAADLEKMGLSLVSFGIRNARAG